MTTRSASVVDPITIELPTEEFRSLPFPRGTNSSGSRAKIATFFVRVEDLPEELDEWLKVNPRIPKLNKKDSLTGPVAKKIVETLIEEPDRFAIRNQGIYILADRFKERKESKGATLVSIVLDDPTLHGIVNGGHTYKAIREAIENGYEEGAFVRVHLMSGIDNHSIPDLAEGLNRSLQVDNRSLENLQGRFEKIKRQLEGRPISDHIAYRQGDLGPIDVLDVLTCMRMFDLNEFPNRRKKGVAPRYPHKVFGQQKAVLDYFVEDLRSDNKVFERVLAKLPELLRLKDEIELRLAPYVGKWAIEKKTAKKSGRAGDRRHKGRKLYAIDREVDNLVHKGWLFPALAAFRALVDQKAWDDGRFEWLIEPMEIIDDVVAEMRSVIFAEHQANLWKPAEVGRKEAAYRGCQAVVAVELAQRQAAAATS